jgi:hypothetical protein
MAVHSELKNIVHSSESNGTQLQQISVTNAPEMIQHLMKNKVTQMITDDSCIIRFIFRIKLVSAM